MRKNSKKNLRKFFIPARPKFKQMSLKIKMNLRSLSLLLVLLGFRFIVLKLLNLLFKSKVFGKVVVSEELIGKNVVGFKIQLVVSTPSAPSTILQALNSREILTIKLAAFPANMELIVLRRKEENAHFFIAKTPN